MKKIVLSAFVLAATLGVGMTASSAYDAAPAQARYQTAQYGGGYNSAPQYQRSCHWERKRVRIWSERRGTWVWVWQRVRVCD